MADGTARSSGGSLKPSHNHGFSLIKAFNNLAPWGEKKFVSELKRTYKFQRGVNNILDCHANQTRILSKEYSFVAGDYVRSTARNDVKRHTEDNSPKYRMVCNGVGLESQTHRNNCGEYRKTVITRSDKRHSNLILLIPHLEIKDFGPPASGGHGSYQCLTNVVNRLRNKCAMTDYGHAELVSASCGLNPSPAFQAPSAQGRQGHTHRTALRFPLSPQVARGKIRSIGNMKKNIFTDMVFSFLTRVTVAFS